MGHVATNYLRLQNTRFKHTSSFHLRINGLCERTNGIMGEMLTRYVDNATHKWDEFLSQAMFAFNVRHDRTSGHSPFYLLNSVEPKLPGGTAPPLMYDEINENDHICYRCWLLESLNQHRQAAIERHKLIAKGMKDS